MRIEHPTTAAARAMFALFVTAVVFFAGACFGYGMATFGGGR